MNIRNRMDDVVSLRCHACQDLLKMIIQPGWQEKLWEETGEKYAAIHEEMCNHGVDSYSVDKMDVTIIYEIIKKRKIASVERSTFFALQQLKDDRNLTQHSSCNEEADELYLRALLSLCDIRSFVRTVAEDEFSIDESIRLDFRRKYIREIEKLMSIIDEERIAIIQRKKDIDRDIQRILESNDPEKDWLDTYESYDRRRRIDGDYGPITEFCLRSSDAGLSIAHQFASSYAGIKKDWEEYNKRLMLEYDSINKEEDISKMDMHSILSGINCYIFDHSESDTIRKILDDLQSRGYIIQKNPRGFYQYLEGSK